jgi:RNA polymerase sigma factor (sigma-70 family)
MAFPPCGSISGLSDLKCTDSLEELLFFEPGPRFKYSLKFVSDNSPETEIGGPKGSFQSTLWSLVLRAKDPNSKDRRQALQKLIETYWKPLYCFVRRKGSPVEEGKDLTQGFFAELLAKDYLKYVDRDRGKFRTFLLTALEHYMADEHDRVKAQKRGGGQKLLSLDFAGAEEEILPSGAVAETPAHLFRRDWAVQVMAQAMDDLQRAFDSEGRAAEFEAFKLHLTSTRPEGASYDDLARSLGISVEDVRNRVRSTRARYRESILAVVRSYTESEEEAREELQDLMTAFS